MKDNMTKLADRLPQVQVVDGEDVEILRVPDVRLCKTCYGTGYIGYDVPFDHPKFGKVDACPDANCPVQRRNRETRARALTEKYGVPLDENYDGYTFATWQMLPEAQRRGKELAFLAAMAMAEQPFEVFSLSNMLGMVKVPHQVLPVDYESADKANWQERVRVDLGRGEEITQNSYGNWLVFEGAYGTGKTGMAVALMKALQAQGHFVVFVRLPDLLRHYQDTYGIRDSDEQYHVQQTLRKPLVDADVLILDEVNVAEDGDGRASNDKIRIFTDLVIDPRWRALHRKPIVMTTNKSAADFRRHWDDRIATRVFERAHWLKFGGAPLRHMNMPIGGA